MKIRKVLINHTEIFQTLGNFDQGPLGPDLF